MGSSGSLLINRSKKFQGSYQRWYEQAQDPVDAPDVIEFVGICKMAAIPCRQEIASIMRSQSQV